jgi:hypothetical protein
MAQKLNLNRFKSSGVYTVEIDERSYSNFNGLKENDADAEVTQKIRLTRKHKKTFFISKIIK